MAAAGYLSFVAHPATAADVALPPCPRPMTAAAQTAALPAATANTTLRIPARFSAAKTAITQVSTAATQAQESSLAHLCHRCLNPPVDPGQRIHRLTLGGISGGRYRHSSFGFDRGLSGLRPACTAGGDRGGFGHLVGARQYSLGPSFAFLPASNDN